MYKLILKFFRAMPELFKCWFTRLGFKPRVGKNVDIYGKIQFEKDVVIGNYTYIHGPGYLGRIHIGKFCSIAKNFSCITTNHDMSLFSTYPFYNQITKLDLIKDKECLESFKPILPNEDREVAKIGNDVWIGESVTIMRGVNIGDGAVIGANSLVLDDIPPYAIAVGTPAKVKRYRLPQEKIDLMLKVKWWDWPIEKIGQKFTSLCNFDENDLL